MKSYLLILGILFICLFSSMSMASKKRNLLDPELSQFENIYSYGQASINNGELSLTSTHNWFFTTKKQFRNFILSAEILMPDVSEYSNSGIMFRGQYLVEGDGKVAMGYQAEVDPSSRKWSGGLFDQARRKWLHPFHPKRSQFDDDFLKNFTPEWTLKRSNAYKHLQWNQYRIECIDNEIKIYVNNVLTSHVLDQKDAEGFIGLQHHGSKALQDNGFTDNVVKFRNVFLTEIN